MLFRSESGEGDGGESARETEERDEEALDADAAVVGIE